MTSARQRIDYNRLNERVKSVLMSDTEILNLSVRATNVLRRRAVKSVGDLVQITDQELLSMPSCGVKTVREIQVSLLKLYLRTGTPILNWPCHERRKPNQRTPEIDFDTADDATRARLVTNLEDYHFTARAKNVIRALGVECLADLVSLSESDLYNSPRCGRRTIREIKSVLREQALSLGTTVRHYDHETGARLRSTLSRTQASATRDTHRYELEKPIRLATSVEDELLALLGTETSERNSYMIAKLWGWLGDKPRTLESVGVEYGLTRERVRQIAAKVQKTIAGRKRMMPITEEAANTVRRSCPATGDFLKLTLRDANLSVVGIDIEGLARACDILGIELDSNVSMFGGVQIYSNEAARGLLAHFQKEVRRASSTTGCVSFDGLCLELNISSHDAQHFRALVSAVGEFIWLDRSHTWFYSTAPTRNRLFNVAAKVFCACQTLRVSELRSAVSRDRRLEVVPPENVLTALLENMDLVRQQGEFLIADPEGLRPIRPGSINATFIRIFKEHGPVMLESDFRKLAISSGINPISYFIYRAHSPVVSKVAPGVYSLVGATPAPGTIEGLTKNRVRAKRKFYHGWEPDGRLWIVLGLSFEVATVGSIALNGFLSEVLQGNWHVALADGTQAGEAVCKGIFFYSMRTAFQMLSVESDDMIRCRFDLSSRVVVAEIVDRFVEGTDDNDV